MARRFTKGRRGEILGLKVTIHHNLDKLMPEYRLRSMAALQKLVPLMEVKLNQALPLRMFVDQKPWQRFAFKGSIFERRNLDRGIGVDVEPPERREALRGIEFGRPPIYFDSPTVVALTKGDGLVEFVTVNSLPATSPHPFIEDELGPLARQFFNVTGQALLDAVKKNKVR